jgi:hypothetical protein
MSDIEFEILDELYFVSSFEELLKNVSFGETELKEELQSLIKKGWVKGLDITSDDVVSDLEKINKNIYQYNYLATKEGLLAHNSR